MMDIPPESPSRATRLRSLTRLLIGGVEFGLDELLRQLQIWEAEVGQSEKAGNVSLPFQGVDGELQGEDQPGSPPDELLPPGDASNVDLFRLAIVGLLFETQDRLSSSMEEVKKIEKLSLRLVGPLLKPLARANHTLFMKPVHRQFDSLVKRGQSELDRWVARGQVEERYSRKLAEVAFDRTVDEYIEYLTNNPEVQELVQTQSTGLANEVIEEVRERTVSADTFLEGVARSLLRRVPRAMLPQPSAEVRQRAAPLRKSKEKT